MGRPAKPAEEKRRQIKVYVSPETEKTIRETIGLKKLGHKLDRSMTMSAKFISIMSMKEARDKLALAARLISEASQIHDEEGVDLHELATLATKASEQVGVSLVFAESDFKRKLAEITDTRHDTRGFFVTRR